MTQNSTTTKSYSYDPVGNRLSSLGVSPYNYNASNQLTSTPSTTYTYDSNGNTLTSATGSNTTTYAWDFENRLTSVTLPETGGTVTFKYDPFGRRIYKSSSSGTSVSAYDGDNLVEETDSSGAVVARYEDTQNIDEPLAMLRSSTTSYYHADGLGSITSLSSGGGSIANPYTYDAFGKLTASTGSLVNPFRYTARESDTETGLYYYRARYYDPNSGKFLNEDPLGFMGGINKYTFVRNRPLNWVDRFGTSESNCGCPEPNNNKMPLARRLGLVGFGAIHVILGGSKMGMAVAAEAETFGMATPIAGYIGVQGAGNFVQGLTEVAAGLVGDSAGESLVNSAADVTNTLSLYGLAVSAMSHDPDAGGAAKSFEGLLSTLVFEPENAPILLLEGAATMYDFMGIKGVLPKKCP